MKLTAPAKVGAFTVLSLLLLVVGLSWLTQTSFRPRGYHLKVVFNDVDGLLPGANVLLMGVKVGRVAGLSPEERLVVVDAEIADPKTRIFTGSYFKILSKGIIGEKALEIFPPEDLLADTLAHDATVYGTNPARLDVAIEQANKALRSLRDLADSPETRLALKDGLSQVKATMAGLNALIAHTDQVAVDARRLVGTADAIAGSLPPDELRAIVADLRALSGGVRKGYETLAGEGDQLADARAALGSLKRLTERLDSLAGQVESFSHDPKLKRDVTEIVTTSRDIVSKAAHAASNPPGISPRFDLMGVQEAQRSYVNGNFTMGLHLAQDSFLLGVEEIGEKNLWNAYWGKPNFLGDGLSFHLGMIRSKIGAGLDWAPAKDMALTGEVFNPVTPGLRLSGVYYPGWWGHRYGLTGAWLKDLSDPSDNRLYVGVQWRPLD
ncbi:MAG TPA: MlaD family protein [Pantanalinema sp.]